MLFAKLHDSESRSMREALKANRGSGLRLAGLLGLTTSLALIVLLPCKLDAQGMGKAPKNNTNPPNPPTSSPVTNILRNPDGWAISPAQPGRKSAQAKKSPSPSPSPPCPEAKNVPRPEPSTKGPFIQWLETWTLDLSTLYQFSDQRSRVGELSWDINSFGIGLAASFNAVPYTSLDLSYVYSHWNGWSPTGVHDIANQHLGSVRILQPLDNIWFPKWKPADQSDIPENHQFAILLGTAYGGSLGRLATPSFTLQHETAYSLVGDTLLDYQFAWFPQRNVPENLPPEDRLPYRDCNTYNYPNLIFEFSTGTQYSTVRLDSTTPGASTTTSERQFDYLNSAILTGSLPCRWGLLVAVTWDAPFDSQPLRGGKSDRANTVTFTGGLVYNLFPSTDPGVVHHPSLKRLSLSLLYSYTAFDPLTETNTVQVQASYSF